MPSTSRRSAPVRTGPSRNVHSNSIDHLLPMSSRIFRDGQRGLYRLGLVGRQVPKGAYLTTGDLEHTLCSAFENILNDWSFHETVFLSRRLLARTAHPPARNQSAVHAGARRSPDSQDDDGDDYYAINSKGSVPVLELDDGERLTEGPVIAQWICDQANRTDLMPAAGSLARYRVMEWQNYVTSELHKAYSPLFRADFDDNGKTWFRTALRKKYEWVASARRQGLSDRQQLHGGRCVPVHGDALGAKRRCGPRRISQPIQGFHATRARARSGAGSTASGVADQKGCMSDANTPFARSVWD